MIEKAASFVLDFCGMVADSQMSEVIANHTTPKPVDRCFTATERWWRVKHRVAKGFTHVLFITPEQVLAKAEACREWHRQYWADQVELAMDPLSYVKVTSIGEVCRWQPIATAPKDGTRIMVWDSKCGRHSLVRADDLLHTPVFLEDATHWMPLPKPPSDCRS